IHDFSELEQRWRSFAFGEGATAEGVASARLDDAPGRSKRNLLALPRDAAWLQLPRLHAKPNDALQAASHLSLHCPHHQREQIASSPRGSPRSCNNEQVPAALGVLPQAVDHAANPGAVRPRQVSEYLLVTIAGPGSSDAGARFG